MDNKYKYWDIKGKKVPDDLNLPVVEMLQSYCPEAVAMFMTLQNDRACGELQIYDKEQPKTIRIKTSYGMCEGYDLIKTKNTADGRFSIAALKHIKNHKLIMKKPEGEKNG